MTFIFKFEYSSWLFRSLFLFTPPRLNLIHTDITECATLNKSARSKCVAAFFQWGLTSLQQLFVSACVQLLSFINVVSVFATSLTLFLSMFHRNLLTRTRTKKVIWVAVVVLKSKGTTAPRIWVNFFLSHLFVYRFFLFCRKFIRLWKTKWMKEVAYNANERRSPSIPIQNWGLWQLG